MQQRLSRDEKIFLLSTALLLFLFILFGTLSLWYQIQRLKRIRTNHTTIPSRNKTVSMITDEQSSAVNQIHTTAMESRKEIRDRMEKEVESLRVFQEELRGQVDLLKVAFAKKREVAATAADVDNDANAMDGETIRVQKKLQ